MYSVFVIGGRAGLLAGRYPAQAAPCGLSQDADPCDPFLVRTPGIRVPVLLLASVRPPGGGPPQFTREFLLYRSAPGGPQWA